MFLYVINFIRANHLPHVLFSIQTLGTVTVFSFNIARNFGHFNKFALLPLCQPLHPVLFITPRKVIPCITNAVIPLLEATTVAEPNSDYSEMACNDNYEWLPEAFAKEK